MERLGYIPQPPGIFQTWCFRKRRSARTVRGNAWDCTTWWKLQGVLFRLPGLGLVNPCEWMLHGFFWGNTIFIGSHHSQVLTRCFVGVASEGTQFEILKLWFRNLNLLHVMMELWKNLRHVHRYIVSFLEANKSLNSLSTLSPRYPDFWLNRLLFRNVHNSLRPAGRVASQFGCFLWVVVSRVFIPRWYCTWDLLGKTPWKQRLLWNHPH